VAAAVKPQQLSQPILLRLLQLDERAAALAKAADSAEREIVFARKVMRGESTPRGAINAKSLRELQTLIKQTEAGFAAQLDAAKRARSAADAAQRVASAVKAYIDGLPHNAKLEPLHIEVDGYDLQTVREQLRTAQHELRTLQDAPIPAPDIADRVRSYVEALQRGARPALRGVRVGDLLQIHWPSHAGANRANLNGFDTTSANPLLLAALLFPEHLTARLMAQLEADCSQPLPISERLPRIAELETQLEQLWRLETALVDCAIADGAVDVYHDPATPAAALLGVCHKNTRTSRSDGAALVDDGHKVEGIKAASSNAAPAVSVPSSPGP
jgi:hypothetical protein